MKLRYRLSLVTFGIIIFLMVTPVLVLYARGFQWDWKNRQFIKTGALVVKTEPADVTIFLNDIKQKSTTPYNVRFLAPGDYNIRLEKEGYATWTKRLSVKSQLVTWANHNRDFITLFLQQPKLEQAWPATEVVIADQKDRIDYLYENQTFEIDVQTGETADLATFPKPAPAPAPEEIRDSLKTLGFDLPNFIQGQIVRSSNQIYLILDNTLYLANDKLEKIYSPVENAFWNADSGALLYSNGNEIYVYRPDTKDSDLILRSLTAVKNPILNTFTGNVFFQNEGKIKAIELDGRDRRNVFTIADALDNFTVSADGKKLFTISQNTINYYTIR